MRYEYKIEIPMDILIKMTMVKPEEVNDEAIESIGMSEELQNIVKKNMVEFEKKIIRHNDVKIEKSLLGSPIVINSINVFTDKELEVYVLNRIREFEEENTKQLNL